jgi:hypothetical protein
MSTPYQQGEALDKILLGTFLSPGKATIQGNPRDKDWDNKKAKGTTGASTVLNGDPVGVFSVLFELYGSEDDGTGQTDFDRWDAFQRLIESTTNGPKPIALTIYHPDLAAAKITEVVNAGVGLPSYDKKGGKSYTVKFQEFKPPKPKAPAKPKGGTANYANTNEGKRSPPDPNAAAKQELARLTNLAKQP